MWNFKSTMAFLQVCCIIACVPAENCDPFDKLPNWEIEEFEPPGDLRLGLAPEVEAALEAQIDNVQENFTLTLFANPFIKDRICPPANRSYHNLRQFHKSRDVIKNGDATESIFFGNIFTGCYYVEMRNIEGKRWLWDPVFYETSYHYYDTMLKCKNFELQSKNNDLASQLNIELEIPLACSQVQVRLFKLSRITLELIDNWMSGNTVAAQDCWVKNIDVGLLPEVKCSGLDTGLIPNATPVFVEKDKNETWSVKFTWDFLDKKDSRYYVSFKLHNEACNIKYSDLMTWRPVVDFGSVLVGSLNDTSFRMYRHKSLDYS